MLSNESGDRSFADSGAGSFNPLTQAYPVSQAFSIASLAVNLVGAAQTVTFKLFKNGALVAQIPYVNANGIVTATFAPIPFPIGSTFEFLATPVVPIVGDINIHATASC
jgi:hypothetical protein